MLHIRTGSGPRLLARAGLALVLAVAGQAVFLPSVSAATLTVTSTADVAPTFGACGNTGQFTSSGSLREAVCAANNAGGASTISIVAGTFTLTNGELQVGLRSGTNITLNGAGAGSTIIAGNGSTRIIEADPSGVGGINTTINNVTITGGNDNTYGGGGIAAGALSSAASGDSLTITNSTISNNHATGGSNAGGGVGLSGGSLTITNSTISNNTTNGAQGAGVYYRAEGTFSGEGLNITGTTFTNNSVTTSSVKFGGGAIAADVQRSSPAAFTIGNSRFVGNTVTSTGTATPVGGAIWVPSGTLNVTESTFTGNSVSGGTTPSGGAIAVEGATATLQYNRITGNTATTGQALFYGSGSVNAANNWWGCNAGPGNAGCDSVSGAATISPRLQLTASASPATVTGPNASSTISAALTTNSLGSAIGSSNLDAFAGVPVSWSDPLPSGATLGAASSNVAAGAASTTYNSQATSGPGHVLATLDNATATATVTVNMAPTITSPATASFTVGTAANFSVTTTGYPGPSITKTGTVPPGMSFVDNTNGTATLSGTPTTGGAYSLSITATNTAGTATQTLNITVGQAPAFTSPASASFTVGTSGSFTVTTTPTAYPTPSITKTGTLPSGLSFVNNGDGTATVAGTPAAGTGGVYPLNLTASNGVNPNGTQTLTVTVNQAPAVTTNPSDQSVNPGSPVTFTAAASGFPTPTVQWQRSTDHGASFSNIAGATSTSYTFTTAAGDNNNQYRAVFTNTAGSATSSAATLTVASAPSISSPDHTSFTISTPGTFLVTTSGFPDPTLTTTGTLPAWLSFTDNNNGTATIAGTPPVGSGGLYTFTINADNGNTPSASQSFTLTVNESPAITSPNNARFVVGVAGSFPVTTHAGFPVATALSKSGALPSGVSFTDNHDGTATIAGTPAAGTTGSYPITITADNGASTPATQSFTLSVVASPTFTTADHTTFTVGTSGSFPVTATSDAGPVSISETGTLPTGVSFTADGNDHATLAGTPAAGTGGTYTITLTATDGVTPTTSQIFTLTVNQPPTISSPDHATFAVGVADSFTVTTHPGTPATTTLTETGSLPSGVTFTDNHDGTATIAGTATAGGSFPITIKASNGVAPDDSQTFTLTVNQAPAITSPDNATFAVGSVGSFTVHTSGAVPSTTTITQTGTLPTGVTFADNHDGTASLGGTPAAGTGGSYPLTIKAENSTGSTTQAFTLTVTELASFTSPDNAGFVIGTAGSFTVHTTAGYPTTTTLAESGTLPSGVSFTDHGDGTATLAGTPAAGTAGTYPLTFSATNGGGTRQQSFTLTVTEAPAITSLDNATFTVGSPGGFTVHTSPPAVTITQSGALPSGVSFTDNHDGTATLAGTPVAGTGGTYTLTISATNPSGTGTQTFTLTVNELANFTSPNHATFIIGSTNSFPVTTVAGYPTTTSISETGSLPSGVSFTDNGDGTATLSGTPASGTSGSYPLTFSATNGTGTRQQSFTLTVQPPNSSPTITSPDHTSFAKGVSGQSFTVTTTAGYPTATTITETGTLPAGVTFADNHDGTATLSGTPTQSGSFSITIKASNGASTDATQSFTLTVTEPPTVSSPDHSTFVVGTAGTFTVTTTPGYPAATTITQTGSLPSGVSFTDNGNGTATLSGTPAAGTAGSYSLVITAGNSAGSTHQTFTLTVQPADAAPAITSADHASFAKGVSGQSFTVTTTGYPAVSLSKTGTLPAGVTFTDNGNGTATLAGTPTATGSFPITITATNGVSPNATQTFTLTVTAPPAITSGNTVTFPANVAGSFTVNTSGFPVATITETGALPAGVSFTDNHNGTATLAGTPTATTDTTYPITIKASNGISPDATQNFTLKVTAVAAVPLPSKAPSKFDGTLGGVPSKVYVNQVLTVTGSGYKAGAPIEIGWYYSNSGQPSKMSVLAHGYADATGKFSIPVTVANNTGSKTVVASGMGSNGKARYLGAYTVVNPPLSASVSLLAGVPLTTTAGKTLTVSGSGYTAGTSIEIGWYLPQSVVGHAVADAAGKFRYTLTVPAQAGGRLVYAVGRGADGRTRYLLAATVVTTPGRSGGSTGGTSTGVSGTGGTGGGLANTGLTDQRFSAASAGALALTGFALMMVGRRRRRDEEQ